MVHFVRRIKEIHPDLMVSQPTYGYPQVTGCEEKIFAGNRNKNILGGHKNICRAQVQAEIDVINASWNPGGTSNGLADTIGLMVYEGDQVSCDWWRASHVSAHLCLVQALLYVKNYAAGSEQWQGFPIQVSNTKH